MLIIIINEVYKLSVWKDSDSIVRTFNEWLLRFATDMRTCSEDILKSKN